MYTLYTKPGSCSTGIVVLLEKLGVPFETKNKANVANYHEIVPTGMVPALKDGDHLITEGAAIVLYLLEKHHSEMLPKDIAMKGEFLQYLMFCYATLHPAYSKLFAGSAILVEGEDKVRVMNAFGDSISKCWAIIDARLANRDFVFSDKATVIDYMLAIYSSWGASFPTVHINLGDNVKKLIERVMKLPEFEAGYKREGISFKKTF